MPQLRDGYNLFGQVVIEPGPGAAQYVIAGDTSGHFGAGGSAPTATTLTANGTATTAPLVLAGSSDHRGQISFGSGTGSATGGEQIRVVFNQAYQTTPIVVIAPVLGATGPTTSGPGAGVGNPGPVILGVGTIGTTGFSIAASTLATSLSNAAITVNYWVLG